MDRRSFLGFTAAAAPLLSGCVSTPVLSAWQSDSDRDRQALIDLANFMPYKTAVSGDKGLAITTHPLATKAAIDAIRDGGNAIDGVCAAALLQTVLEPDTTSITGIFSMLYYEAATGQSYYLNGGSARPLKFKAPDGVANPTDLAKVMQPIDYALVPGYWAGWQAAHDRFGLLSRKRVMAPSIHYANEGFEVHPGLWGSIYTYLQKLGVHPEWREVYMPNNTIIGQGEKIYQRRYADLLARLVDEGSDYYYHGGFAERYVSLIQQAGGVIDLDDLARYQAVWAEPAKGRYRDYDLVASPPPDFGGTNVAEVLQILEHANLKAMGPAFESPDTAYLMIKALNEVWTETMEQNWAMASSGKRQKHWRAMLDLNYAAQRYQQIKQGPPRQPDWLTKSQPGTNHLTVCDGDGNVATVLHSHAGSFGGVGKFLEGAFISASGHYFSGPPEPGGHMNYTVAPFMVMKDGKPVIACGSPSISLQECLVQNITNIVDFGMTVEESVNRPRFGGDWSFSGRLIEADMGHGFIDQLSKKMGISLNVVNPRHVSHGSFDGMVFNGKTAIACGDPRRGGTPMAV